MNTQLEIARMDSKVNLLVSVPRSLIGSYRPVFSPINLEAATVALEKIRILNIR